MHGHCAAQSLFTFLPLQPVLSGCDADGGSARLGSRDSKEQKSFWDHSGMGKRSGAVGRGGEEMLHWGFGHLMAKTPA